MKKMPFWVVSLSCLVGVAASSAFGEIATNKWIATGGGRWSDAANWSNPELLGTPFFADFGELDAEGDGVTIGVSTAKTKVCGMRFKGSSGGWNRYAFKSADDMTEKGFQQELFEFHGANGENSVLDVPTRATVVFSGALKRCSEGATKTDHIEKTGGGMIHFDHAEAPTLGPLWIRDGWLENFTSASLRHFGMRLFPRGLFRLNADLGMGKLVFESTSDFNPIRLNGHRLTFGYGWQDQSFVGNAFTNDERVAADTVSVVGSAAGSTVTFSGRQQAKLDLRLNDGDIRFSNQQSPLVACFFNDAAAPGRNDGTLADLVTGAGTAQIVNDADRGNVLYLDGQTKLIGSDANGNLDGLPTGDGDYTISLWLKIAEGVTDNAGILFWGTWSQSGQCTVLRCEGGFTKKQFMLSHYGDNFFMNNVSAAYDKTWHHLVIVRRSGKESVYLDDNEACSKNISADIQKGTFNLGYGQSAYFKGWIDDLVIFPVAVDPGLTKTEESIRALAESVGFYERGAVEFGGHGTLHLDGARTIGALTGASAAGRVRMAGDLTVAGTGSTVATVYRAELVGEGDFVKRGADYALTLEGESAYSGATRVEEGRLAVRDPSPATNQVKGLVAEYRFDAPGDIGRDSSGNQFNLSVFGSAGGVKAVMDEERGGLVAEFDSANKSYLKSGAAYPATFPSGNSAYSVSVWFKPAADVPGSAAVWFWGDVASDKNKCAAIMRLDGDKGAMFSNWGNNYFVGGNGGANSYADGKWHHAVMTYDGRGASDSRHFYVDGTKLKDGGASALTIATDGYPFYLGWRMNGGDSNYYKGRMDDVRVYSFALTDAEAAAEYAGGRVVSHNELVEVEPSALPQPVVRFDFESADAPYKSVGGTAEMELEPVGTPTVVADDQRAGRVLSLGDASAMSYLQAKMIPDSLPHGSDEKITISFWMRPKSGQNPGGNECAFYYGDPNDGFHLIGNNGDYIRYTIKAGGADLGLNDWCLRNLSVEKQWYHVVCTLDRAGSGAAFYIDGVKIAEKVDLKGGALKQAYFYLGRKTSSDTDWFHGSLDDVAVYDRVFTADEVARLYREESGRAVNRQVPPTTDLTVSEGATFAVLRATETTVRSLSGAGRVEIEPAAKLTVTDAAAFSGTFAGDGKVALAPTMNWTVSADEEGYAKPGTYKLLTLPVGMLDETDMSAWTVTPALRSGTAKFKVTDNGDGTKTVSVRIPSVGLFLIVR